MRTDAERGCRCGCARKNPQTFFFAMFVVRRTAKRVTSQEVSERRDWIETVSYSEAHRTRTRWLVRVDGLIVKSENGDDGDPSGPSGIKAHETARAWAEAAFPGLAFDWKRCVSTSLRRRSYLFSEQRPPRSDPRWRSDP